MVAVKYTHPVLKGTLTTRNYMLHFDGNVSHSVRACALSSGKLSQNCYVVKCIRNQVLWQFIAENVSLEYPPLHESFFTVCVSFVLKKGLSVP